MRSVDAGVVGLVHDGACVLRLLGNGSDGAEPTTGNDTKKRILLPPAETKLDTRAIAVMHPNEELLRKEYEARAARDDRALAEVFAEDVVWHVPGKNAIAGDYRGIEEVTQYVRRRRELAGGTLQITVHDMLANHDYGLVVASGRATRGGKAYAWRAHGLYRFRNGRIAECWVLPENQYEFDRIWR